jgi:uncharacterized protein with GYD domain
MPHYVALANWTDQGIRNVKETPKRAEALRKAIEGGGGKVVVLLYTMGPYDAVAVYELPSDEVANEIALRIGMQGNIRTVSLKGWTEAEIAKTLQKL